MKTLFLSVAVGALAGPALAHAADQGFVLLLPTGAYIAGGTIVVAATILLLLILKPGSLERLFRPVPMPFTAPEPPLPVALIASAVLALLIIIGFRGPADPQANLLPLVIWTVWWMLLFIIQGLVFDIWRWVNPFRGLHQLMLPEDKAILTLPEGLRVWPAVLIMAAFQGYVLADVAPNDPDRLSRFALGYWAFTLIGMSVFGRDRWLRQVECFTVLFDLIGRLRVFGRQAFGFPGWQALGPFDLSHAVFVIVLLASGSFDGLYETFWWLGQMGVNPLEYPGRSAMIWPTALGLYGSIALLGVIMAGCVGLGAALVRVPFKSAFIPFAITLLPIAIGYHFAHYFVTFLVQIQVVKATLADPLARGWNLFGLADTRVMVGFLTVPATVKAIWLTQAGVVVASHVIAVLMSHRVAESLCKTRGDVLKIQLGISTLMILYTIFGLWLLASPRGA